MPSKLAISERKKLSADHKRLLMKQIFEEHFAIPVLAGSTLDNLIQQQFRPGQKNNKFNTILDNYTSDTSPIKLAQAIAHALTQLCHQETENPHELLQISDFLQHKLIPLINILNGKNTVEQRTIALNAFIAHTIDSLINKGLPPDALAINRLKNLQIYLKDVLALDMAGQILQAASPLLKMHDLLTYGHILRQISPQMLLITAKTSSTDESLQASFSVLYHIGTGLKQPKIQRISQALQNAHWLSMLDLHTNECRESLEEILHNIDMKLGQNTIYTLKLQLRTQGISESEAIEIFKLLKQSPSNCQLIQETRQNQKFAAASMLIANIAQQINCQELEKLALASLCVVSARQFYSELSALPNSKYKLTSLTQTTGIILEASGKVANNRTIETIGKGILAGVSAYQLAISTLPGGALVALPLATLNIIGSLMGNKKAQRQQEAYKRQYEQHTLAYIKECYKCILALHNSTQSNFIMLYRELQHFNQHVTQAFERTAQLFTAQHQEMKTAVCTLSNEVAHLQYVFSDGLRELYLQNILSPLARYELLNQISTVNSVDNFKSLFIAILEWVLIKSQQPLLNGYNLIYDNNCQPKERLLALIMHKSPDHLSILGAIEAYLRLEGLGNDFGLSTIPNLPIWLQALSAIDTMLNKFNNELEFNVMVIYDQLTKQLQIIQSALLTFASNTRLLEFLTQKVTAQYSILLDEINEQQASSEFKDYLLDFTSINDKLFSMEYLKQILQHTPTSLEFHPRQGDFAPVIVDASEIFFKLVYPQITHDLGICAYLDTLRCSISSANEDHIRSFVNYINTETLATPQNINNPHLLPLKLCYSFSIKRQNNTVVFATVVGNAQTGGLKIRHKLYQSLFGSIPELEQYYCINMLGDLIYHSDGKKQIKDLSTQRSYKPQSINPTLEEFINNLHNNLLAQPKEAFTVEIKNSQLLSLVEPEARKNREQSIKASMYAERTNLAAKIAKNSQSEALKKASIYSKIANLILSLRNSPYQLPDMLQETSKLIAALVNDRHIQQNFMHILACMQIPANTELLENPDFTTHEIWQHLDSYINKYDLNNPLATANLSLLFS